MRKSFGLVYIQSEYSQHSNDSRTSANGPSVTSRENFINRAAMGRFPSRSDQTSAPDNGIGTIHHSDWQPVCCGVSVGCCRMSVVDSIVFVVAASHVAASISAWSCAIPHQWAIQWVIVWSQKFTDQPAHKSQRSIPCVYRDWKARHTEFPKENLI
jgi:hypothetical protein